MIQKACSEYNIDMENSYMVGIERETLKPDRMRVLRQYW